MTGAILKHMTGEELLLMAVLEGRHARGGIHAELDRRARVGMPVRRRPRAAAVVLTATPYRIKPPITRAA
jgi:hypothetical protein